MSVVLPSVIGREEQLEAIGDFLSATEQGASLLILEGEPGIGKTTLWRRGIADASDRSHQILSASCVPAEARLSFAALGDLLADTIEVVLPELPAPQRRALEVALLLAEPSGEPPDQRAVAIAFLSGLRLLAARGPVVVAIDDLQWLDDASFAVIAFTARRVADEPIGFLLTRRIGEADEARLALDRAFPEGHLWRLPVGPLSLGAVQHLLYERFGAALTRPVVQRIWEGSGGNPMFALELAHALQGRESVSAEDPLPLPETLTSLVEGRVTALPGVAQEVLRLAAAAAAPSVELVERALGAGARSGVLEAVEAGVVEIDDGRIRFAHPLLASTVYAGCTHVERRALHALLARTVEDFEERARHVALAVEEPDEMAAAALEEAGELAHRRGAPAAAASFYEQAARLTPANEPDHRRRRIIAAASYHFQSGDAGLALRLLTDVVAEMPTGREHALALSRLARIHNYEGDQKMAARLFKQALVEADGDPSISADAAEGLATSLFYLREDLQGALRQARFAVHFAEEAGDRETAAIARGTQALVEALLGRKSAAQTARSALPEESRRLSASVVRQPRFDLAVVSVWADDFDGARAALLACHEQAIENGDESSFPFILTYLALTEFLDGRWDQAARAAAEGYQAGVQTGQRVGEAFALSALALIRACRGRVADSRTDAETVRALVGDRAAVLAASLSGWALGLLDLSLGHPDEAHRHLEPLVARARNERIAEPGSIRFVGDDIEALIALGRLGEASSLLDWFEGTAKDLERVSVLGVCARCHALLSAAQGHHDAAEEAIAASLEWLGHTTMPFERARTLLVAGTLLRRARRLRDARETLEEALGLFEEMGAALWAENADTEKRRIGGRAPSRWELTPTEQKVADLAVEGLTNKEIAQALVVALKTVEATLSRVYTKLGVRSRTQLARRLGPAPHDEN